MEIFRKKNVDTRVVFPILDADRDFVTAAADLDSEYASWDTADHGGAAPSFSDCTHEAAEIGATGVYYLDIDGAEINKDYTMIQVKTSTVDAKTVSILIRTLKTDAEVAEIGTPVAVDGGAATLAGMLTKIVDDNGGASFDATTDSLNKVRDAIDVIDNYVDNEISDLATAIGTPVAVDGGVASLAGMLTKIVDDNGGADFDATYDSLNKVRDAVDAVDDYVDSEIGDIATAIGTPVALDGGLATLAGMLTKIADDNGGADYDAGTDSLHEVSDNIEVIDAIASSILIDTAEIGTGVSIDGGAATIAGMITKIVDDNDGGTYDATNDSLNKVAVVDAAIKAQTDQIAFSGGDVVATLDSEEVALIDGAITAAKIDADAITAAKVADDVIDAVWDELQAGHAVSDSFGEYLNCPISDATRELGMGILSCLYNLTLSDNGLPISNAHVWVSTDSGHVDIVAHGITDAFGNVTFNLDPGTYYLWRHKNGVNFTNPMSMTVSEVSTSAIGTGTLTTSVTTARVRVVTYAGSS